MSEAIEFTLNDQAVNFTLNGEIESALPENLRLLEDGDYRITEDDEFRILES